MKPYIICAILVVLAERSLGESEFPFMNISLSWEERVDDLVSRLTLQEMVGMMSEGGGSGQPYIHRLDLKPYQFDSECLHGEVYGHNVAFPAPLGLAAMFR